MEKTHYRDSSLDDSPSDNRQQCTQQHQQHQQQEDYELRSFSARASKSKDIYTHGHHARLGEQARGGHYPSLDGGPQTFPPTGQPSGRQSCGVASVVGSKGKY